MVVHFMDGAAVVMGDRVYDVAYGPGRVEELYKNGRFGVTFADKRLRTYNHHGITPDLAGRTLFWAEPYIELPQKNAHNYRLYVEICQAVSRTVNKLERVYQQQNK